MEIKGKTIFCHTTGNIDNDTLLQAVTFDFLDVCNDSDIEEIEDIDTAVTVYIERNIFKFIGEANAMLLKVDDRVKIQLSASDIVFSIDITDPNLVIILDNDDKTTVDRYIVIMTANAKIIMEQSIKF